jgi:two-component system, OmpR family, sensor histidine kinase ChvG
MAKRSSNPVDLAEARAGRLNWTRRTSLTVRILAVNGIALGLLAGSLFYLDSYRNQLIAGRFQLASSEAELIADALAETPTPGRRALLARIAAEHQLRLRLYDVKGRLKIDTFVIAEPSFRFADPTIEPWYQDAARWLDRGMDRVLGSDPIPPYADPAKDEASAWPELVGAARIDQAIVVQRAAPDQTPVINAAAPVGIVGEMLLSTRNAVDVTQAVRDARSTLGIVIGVTFLISILLSLFLARTIVRPLRALVRAAVRVRLGRAREVVVPRLPERGDEIGLLARALSDMTSALRQRIDSVEAFAADVAHEIKNPLASLRSALESLEKVDDPKLRKQLSGIASHDVQRIDRLVTEIAEASRIDAELSRTQFDPVDLAALARALAGAREERGELGVTVTAKGRGPWLVAGDPARLERVLVNLLDNAASFSPSGGAVAVTLQRDDEDVVLRVSDDGPGIAPEARTKVFERFHSLRPEGEDFGSHSGLGLAIARTIAAAHDGSLEAKDRSDGKPGACLELRLPVYTDRPEED